MVYTIPVFISTLDLVFNFTHWEIDCELKQVLATATTRAGAGYPPIVVGNEMVNAPYQVAASFCTPKVLDGSGKEKNVIIATHGIGLGREHWNSAYKPEE